MRQRDGSCGANRDFEGAAAPRERSIGRRTAEALGDRSSRGVIPQPRARKTRASRGKNICETEEIGGSSPRRFIGEPIGCIGVSQDDAPREGISET